MAPATTTETKAVLLREAEVLIRRRGYSGFSYADLSDTVGIRKASIHYHYPTKETLVVAVLQTYRARYAKGLSSITNKHASALDRIEAYGRLYLTGVEQSLGCLCAALAAELETLPESLRSGTAEFFQEHITWLENIYTEGLANGEVRKTLKAREAARMIVAALEGALLMERMVAGPQGFKLTLSALRKSLSPCV
ncbi:MAG: TetR/AcrR family transcriptional regulator [Afipia felis]|nr:TetR/AcrR family transcriptional regulator [Afipia felis]